jgi:ribosomal protein S18 acetylase RimI-like enzyme
MLEAYRLYPAAFTSGFEEKALLPLNWWENRLSVSEAAKDVVLGLWVKNVLCGVVGVQFESREKIQHKSTLFGMYVSEQFQKRGYGRALVGSAIDAALLRQGVNQMQLTVTEGNTRAVDLYESFGFQQYGIEPKAFFASGVYLAKVHMSISIGDAEIVG